MSQSLNVPGIFYYPRMLFNPALMIPHIMVRSIADINPSRLKNAGIQAVAVDKDNTLTDPYSSTFNPLVEEAVEHFRDFFGRDFAIVSNDAGTPDDSEHSKADMLEDELDIPVIHHRAKKPSCGADLLRYFGCRYDEIAVIGDRVSTDIALGNRHGMLTILTQPFTSKGDNLMAKVLRPIERRVVEGLMSAGLSAPYNKRNLGADVLSLP